MEKGTIIIAKHHKSNLILHYLIVKDVSDETFRLINMDTYHMMAGFKAKSDKDIIRYICGGLKCEIVGLKQA